MKSSDWLLRRSVWRQVDLFQFGGDLKRQLAAAPTNKFAVEVIEFATVGGAGESARLPQNQSRRANVPNVHSGLVVKVRETGSDGTNVASGRSQRANPSESNAYFTRL